MNNTMKMGKCGCISSNIWVVKGDTRSQIVTISVPRMEGGVDLSNLAWYIKIENAAKVTDICRPEAGSVVVNDETITFDWLICGIATAFVGTTHFAVEGVNETVDGHPIVWRSAPGAIYVGENLDAEISSESEADLSNLQKLIVYVNGELDNVIAAGKAAVESANAAASTNRNIKDAEFKRVSAENARVEAENARSTAETLRQSAFDVNEAGRHTAFESAENRRESEWTEIKHGMEISMGTAVADAEDAAKNANSAAESANAAAEKSVRYDAAQTLSDAQKAQARGNIDAADAESVDALKGDLADIKNGMTDIIGKEPPLLEWEIGAISGTGENNDGSNIRIRTRNYIFLEKGHRVIDTMIGNPSGYGMIVYQYDVNKQFKTYTGFNNPSAQTFTASEDMYVRLVLSQNNLEFTEETLTSRALSVSFPDDGGNGGRLGEAETNISELQKKNNENNTYSLFYMGKRWNKCF